jgi:hypothetical protein
VNRRGDNSLAIDFGGMRFTESNCLDDRGGSLPAHELNKAELGVSAPGRNEDTGRKTLSG